MARNVSITLQTTEESRAIIGAIETDNPGVVVHRYPAMVKIDCPGKIVVRRDTVSTQLGRDWNVQEIHLSLVSLAGNIDEDDDQFVLAWG